MHVHQGDRQLDLPYNQEYNDCQHQIVCLIVQQVADHSVVPFRQISRVWFGEALWARIEIIPASQRSDLHFSH